MPIEAAPSLEAWRDAAAGRGVVISHRMITLVMHDAAGRWEASYPTREAALAAIARGPDWHRGRPQRRVA